MANANKPTSLLSIVTAGALVAACGDDSSSAGEGTETGGTATGLPADGTAATPADDTGADTVAETGSETGGPNPSGEGLFVDGCPVPGVALAKEITNPDLRMTGDTAVGGAGDYLLMNEQAAFMIQGVDRGITYYHYGGIVMDAVAIDGCEQAADEQFDEIGLLFGKPNIGDFQQSTLRAFRAESIEVVNDGSDGEAAVVRVRGVDDYYWLIEYELIRGAFESGTPKPVSQPMGVEVVIDYTLEPDSNVLAIDFAIHNELDTAQEFMAAAVVTFGDTTAQKRYFDGVVPVAGLNLQAQVPWLMASSGAGAYAFGIAGTNLSFAKVAGVNAALDFSQVFNAPLVVGPKGDEDSASMRFVFAVGGGDANTAVRGLQRYDDVAVGASPYTLTAFGGQVSDASRTPIPNAEIDIKLLNTDDSWETFESFHSDADGEYGGMIADLGDPRRTYQIHASAPGYADIEPIDFTLPSGADQDIVFGDRGEMAYDITDGDGRPSPARLSVYRDGSLVTTVYAAGEGSAALAPGDYEVDVSRGIEYAIETVNISVPNDGVAMVQVALDHVVDTTGFLSMDSHIHAGPSPDSGVVVPDRLRTVAAAGVEVAIGTDHEIIVDWTWGLAEAGLEDFLATVIGQEVTASVPEHTIMYPVVPDGSTRGGNVPWYQLDLGGIYAAERERGAQIVTLNHPRGGCNYLCIVGWDRVAGAPALSDPTQLGLSADAELWSWDFDAVEYMNGIDAVFVDPASPDDTGLFDDWQSFLNHGHSVTATGVTDAHSSSLGLPRNYFESPTDDVTQFAEADLVSSMLDGRALVSAGAFARVQIDGAGMGDLASAPGGAAQLELSITALPEIDVTHFKVFANCDEVATLPTDDPGGLVKYEGAIDLVLAQDAHITVLGFGEQAMPRSLTQYDPDGRPRFTTNAIYVDVDGNGVFDAPGGKTCTYTVGPPGR